MTRRQRLTLIVISVLVVLLVLVWVVVWLVDRAFNSLDVHETTTPHALVSVSRS